MEHKTVRTANFKLGAEPGSFRATFATLNTIDLDGDVTEPGAFQQGAQVKVAQWGHNWALPSVGKGTIHADGARAWIIGQFNMKTAAGVEHYEVVKFNGQAQEFSYGFDVIASRPGVFEGRSVRFLEALTVHEVSPVMLAAGVGTRLETIKLSPERRQLAEIKAGLLRPTWPACVARNAVCRNWSTFGRAFAPTDRRSGRGAARG